MRARLQQRGICIITGVWLLLGCAACLAAELAPDEDWLLFQKRYVSVEGRVIDTGNVGISHSEGQGTGMLFAVHNKDRRAFDNIWRWTHANLQVRDDRLLAWKWVPEGTGGRVTDKNNATDGDLFAAWALYRAARLWNDAAYLKAAREISRDIRIKLVGQSPHGLYLLPAVQGFVKQEIVTVNLSYWIFPALQEIHSIDPAPEWAGLITGGLNLLKVARFGRWQLPPDWLQLAGKPEPAPEFKPRFGHDAVRIPLYLIWAKLGTAENVKPFTDFWSYFAGARFVPSWCALTDDSVDSYNASTGIQAIIALARAQPSTATKKYQLRLPKLSADQDYYSANLFLLTKMAAVEMNAK